MFTPISDGYYPWDNLFIFHSDGLERNTVENTLDTFAYKMLLKSYVKRNVAQG